ncbi:MAG: hypothetical protein ACLP2H_13410 [Terriglobales bacterium]
MITPPISVLDPSRELLSLDMLAGFSQHSLTFAYRRVRPAFVSELTDPVVPSASGVIQTLPLLSIELLTTGFTGIAAALSRVCVVSFDTLVFGRPLSTPQPLSEAVQLTPLHWVPHLRRVVDDVAALPDDWDTEGGRAFSPETVATAKQVLNMVISRAIRSDSASGPSVVPLADGSIRFEWAVGSRELFLTISGTQIEAQRWEPRDADESIYYAEIDLSGVPHELGWVAP